jgi:hypothetical protein
MAAVLCQTLSEMFRLPCKACGIGCAGLGDVLKSPFFPYLAVTFTLNMPAVVYMIRSLDDQCPYLSRWLIGNGLLCLVHMIAAWYIVSKIRESVATNDSNGKNTNNGEIEEGTYYTNFTMPKENEHGAQNSCSRIKHVLCYDKVIAIYIIMFIGWVVWLSMGVGRRLSAGYNGCEEEIHYMNVDISCGYMYISLVGLAFCCSLCCLR